jgi:hypothetical protein
MVEASGSDLRPASVALLQAAWHGGIRSSMELAVAPLASRTDTWGAVIAHSATCALRHCNGVMHLTTRHRGCAIA